MRDPFTPSSESLKELEQEIVPTRQVESLIADLIEAARYGSVTEVTGIEMELIGAYEKQLGLIFMQRDALHPDRWSREQYRTTLDEMREAHQIDPAAIRRIAQERSYAELNLQLQKGETDAEKRKG